MVLYLSHLVTKKVEDNILTLFNCESNNSVDIFDVQHPVYGFLSKNQIDITLENLSEEYQSDIVWLIEEKFLLEQKDLIFAQNLKIERKTSLQLILLPAGEACNLACVYCYEEHNDRKSMNMQHQQILLQFIKSQNKDMLSIEYFGGEPTLNMKFITQFGDLLKENNIQFYSSITTNGTLINEKILKQLYDANVKSFQITLDGYRELHNKLRPSKNGSIDSFDNVINALKVLANSSYEDINITVRLNVNTDSVSSTNFSKFINVIESVIPKSDKRFYILPKIISDYSSSNLVDNEMAREVYCSSRDSADLVTTKIESYIDENYQSATALWLTRNGGFSCYAGNPNSFVITPDMKVRKCTVALNDPINTVGYLNDEGKLIKTVYFDLWNRDYSDSSCRRCFLYKSCQGNSCPLSNIKNERKVCPPFKFQSDILTTKVSRFYNRMNQNA